MADESTLQLVVDADSWGSLVSFEPEVPVQLGGALELTFSTHVNPRFQVGRTTHIFDWTGVSPEGRFTIQSPYIWDVTNLYATGEVTLLAIPEPATLALGGTAILSLSLYGRKRRSVR